VVYARWRRSPVFLDSANYDEDLDLDGLTKPSFSETVDCLRNFWNLCGGPRYGGDVADEYAHSVAILDFGAGDSSFATFLFCSRCPPAP